MKNFNMITSLKLVVTDELVSISLGKVPEIPSVGLCTNIYMIC